MTDIETEKPTDTETPAPEKKKRGRKRKPTFSDEELAEFKAWKAEKAADKQVVADAPEDDKVRRKWLEEKRLVKGIFRCRDPEGGSIKFPFRKYKWDSTEWYDLADGETYEIPLAVARHLNTNCGYPIHSHILGPDGTPSIDKVGKIKSRMNFESTEFAI